MGAKAVRVYVCLMWDTGDLVGMCVFGTLPTGSEVKAAWREIHGCPSEVEFRVKAQTGVGCWVATLHVGEKQVPAVRAEIREREIRS